VDDLPVRDDVCRVGREGEENRGRVATCGREVGRVAVDLAPEAEAVAVIVDRAIEVRDEKDG
jgi:hypothetical protein